MRPAAACSVAGGSAPSWVAAARRMAASDASLRGCCKTTLLFMCRRVALLFVATALAAAPDQHESCRTWAENGECDANPEFMNANCATSCSKANVGSYRSQMKRECAGHAQQGECSRNPAFMLSTCRSECDAWEKQVGLKIDRDASCVEWSILGRCEKDPVRMAAQCNTSCTVHQRCNRSSFTGWSVGICDKALRCEAQDKSSSCVSRAARGECKKDPMRMAVECLQACSAFDVDSVLAAQRPEMRAILSNYYDLPVSMARSQERCWLPGWAGHNHFKMMLPTQCASSRKVPWARFSSSSYSGGGLMKRYSALPPTSSSTMGVTIGANPYAAPSQRVIGKSEDALTCPLDLSQTTPRVARPIINVTFGEASHTPHNVSVVQVLPSPRVRLLRNFLTPDEAAEILKISEPLFHRSPVRSVAQDRRTSSTATLAGGMFGNGRGNWAVKAVRERISAFSGYSDHMLEPLQVVRTIRARSTSPIMIYSIYVTSLRSRGGISPFSSI